MKNIRFLRQRIDWAERTDFAVFFEHDGFPARLDWSISDAANITLEQMEVLMLEQMALDLATDWLIEEIRSQQTGNMDESVQRFLDDGFVEQDAVEFKARALALFGDQ